MTLGRFFSRLASCCPRSPDSTQSSGLQIEVESLESRVYLGGFAAGPGIPGEAVPAPGSKSPAPPAETLVIRYDFRDVEGFENHINQRQIEVTEQLLAGWSKASGHEIQFIHDRNPSAPGILNLGVGDLGVAGFRSNPGGMLGVGGGQWHFSANGSPVVEGIAWLDSHESWDIGPDAGMEPERFDFRTVMSHEIGHALGLDHDASSEHPIMSHDYLSALSAEAFAETSRQSVLAGLDHVDADQNGIHVEPMMGPGTQLSQLEVRRLLHRASAATSSEDAIIAVVDRQGQILGVQIEQDIVDRSLDNELLSFMVDGAVAKARTSALFSNGDPSNGTVGPLTSRTVRFISQSTITQREVEANPNSADSTIRGPGFVAPVGLGGHFPPEVDHTPVVDLFAIEHTNRDSLVHAGPDGIRGTGDDINLVGRFNAVFDAHQDIAAPESYGAVSGLAPHQQSRGIATLPGGIPVFRDTNGDGSGDFLVGGIGVFFPGEHGFASHEQAFIAGIGQTELQRTNAPLVLESEYIAFAAVGGSRTAETFGTRAPNASAAFETLGGEDRIADVDLPFGVISLVGINLEVYGPTGGIEGVRELMAVGREHSVGTVSGVTELFSDGEAVPEGWLVSARDGNGITKAEVEQIINEAILSAREVRAAVRLPLSSQTRMVFAITDLDGEVVGLFRMKDATTFSIDVAVAKARNVRYYADATALQPEDRVDGVDPGVAFTNRTFRFLAEPRFPDGVDGTDPPQFSTLGHASVNPRTAENIGAPAAADSLEDSVLGYDSFRVGTNFRDQSTPLENQNGIVFFPGSTPLYRNGSLIGGFGVSGDGVDQDDVVTFLAARKFLPDRGTTRADQVSVDGVRLPYMKFLRNPFGTVR